MVDTIPDDELNAIYARKQTKMVSDDDKRDQTSITEWLTRGVPEKATSNTKRLAEALAEPDKIKKDIDDIKFKKMINEEKQLSQIERKIEKIKVEIARKEVERLAEDKKMELRQERLILEGKSTTFFRNQIRQSTTEEQIRDILSEAKYVLGEGKNLQSLEDGAEIMIKGLG